MPKESNSAISTKSTKEQILAAYNEVLTKLSEKQVETPQEQKKQEEEQKVIMKATNHSRDSIFTDLNSLKSAVIEEVDILSDQLLDEYKKLSDLREAIVLEQKHLQELYQINDTANTLSVLLRTQAEQQEQFKLGMEQKKHDFEQETTTQRAHWQQEIMQLEQDYKEQKNILEKTRKREEEEYNYILEIRRRKEIDEYNNKKDILEKELDDLKNILLKRETDILEKENNYESLKTQVEKIPDYIKEAVDAAETLLRNQMTQQYEFENQLKQKEYDGILKLNEQSISYLKDTIKNQETLIKELTEKTDAATQQVQSIACRALETTSQRFVTLNKSEEK